MERARKLAAKQGAAAHAAGYRGNAMLKLQRMVANFTGMTRHDTMEGRDYIVAPMIMMVEGVHKGNYGPVYYPKDELAKTSAMWNYRPVIVYHPMKNGEGCSALDPVILSNRRVGVIMNTELAETENGPGLKAEAWLEQDRMNAVDERIAVAVEKGQMMELSTGLWVDNDETPGEWNDEKYSGTVSNYRPDHLALLPDLKGACSIEDGAGFLRLNARPEEIKMVSNAMSHGNIRSLLNSWLQERNKNKESYDTYVEDVYDDFFVFTEDSKLFKGNYSVVDNVLNVTNAFEEVVRVTEYRTTDGKFVGNENNNSNRKDRTMDKKKVIDALIQSNSNSWGEDDREVLTTMDEGVLTKMQSSEKLAAEKAVENAVEKYRADETEKKKKADETAQNAKKVENTAAEKKPKTVDEYIDNAPSEIAHPLRSMMTTYNATKDALVKLLVDNEKCKFNEEQLRAKDVDELKNLVALTSDGEKKIDELDFSGQGLEPVANVEEPLVAPAVVNVAS